MSIVKTVYIVYSRLNDQLASLYNTIYTIYISIVKTVYIVYSRFYQLASLYISGVLAGGGGGGAGGHGPPS